MRAGSGLVLLAVALAAPIGAGPARSQTVPTPSHPCQPHYNGTFAGSFNDDGRTVTLTAPYAFTDAECREWQVPAGAVVDGASIPKALWTVVGGPFEGTYRNASVIHDWYCDRRSQPWEAVHRMFYDAMLASGVEPRKAKLLYLAVYYGGPRWSAAAVVNNRMATAPGLAGAVIGGAAAPSSEPAGGSATLPEATPASSRKRPVRPSVAAHATAAVRAHAHVHARTPLPPLMERVQMTAVEPPLAEVSGPAVSDADVAALEAMIDADPALTPEQLAAMAEARRRAMPACGQGGAGSCE